jgi:general secretion pathway protein G
MTDNDNNMRKRSKGFSLIELMVVVSIMAILMAVGAVSYTTAQKKGRDAKRRTDMKAVQNGFEQYYSLNNTYVTPCTDMATPQFLPGGLPVDPKPGQAYTVACTAVGGGPEADTYCACARLENESGNSSDQNCSYTNVGNRPYFCVNNQQ